MNVMHSVATTPTATATPASTTGRCGIRGFITEKRTGADQLFLVTRQSP
jgi:hypothetical protein